MKRLLLLLLALSLMKSALTAGIVFDNPIPIFEADNLALDQGIKVFPNGNILVTFSKNLKGLSVPHIQVFSADYQPVWTEALPLPNLFAVDIHPDNSIAVGRYESYRCWLDTYDPEGNPIPELTEIEVLYSWYPIHKRFVADGAGGVYFWSIDGSVKYNHVDAQGNLSYSTSGRQLCTDAHGAPGDLIRMSDGGAIIAIPRADRLSIFRLGASHSLIWTTTFEGPQYTVSDPMLSLRADGSFYAVWVKNHKVYANLISSTGQKLWDQNFSPAPDQYQVMEVSGVNSEGNLILFYHIRETKNNYYGIHCFDVINSSGETVHSYVPYADPNRMGNPYQMQILPQDQGGWFLLATRDPDHVSPYQYVLYYDSDYLPWTSMQFFHNQSMEQIFAHCVGDELGLIFLIDEPKPAGIFVQSYDTLGNAGYSGSGQMLINGTRYSAADMKALPLSDGRLFVAWRQHDPSTHAFVLMYQIINPDGTFCFAEAQKVMGGSSSTSMYHYFIFETEAGNALLVWQIRQSWQSEHTSFAQLISPHAGKLWEATGRELFYGGGVHHYSYYEDSLYLIPQPIGSDINLHRFVDGYPVWGAAGVLLGTTHPDYPGTGLSIHYFQKNQVCWRQHFSNYYYSDMSFTNFFDTKGNTLYPPDQAVQMTVLSGDYVGVRPIYVFRSEEAMLYFMGFEYWHFGQEGHSDPGSWEIRLNNYLQRANPDGSPLGDPIPSPSPLNRILLYHDDALYCSTYYGQYIIKQCIDGSSETRIYLPVDMTVKSLGLLPDERILIQGNSNNDAAYAFLDADLNIEYPAENPISDIPCQGSFVTDMGAWFLMSQVSPYYDFAGIYAQYLELLPWNNGGPPASPEPNFSLQSYPNPFRESAEICVKLSQAAPIKLKIYNLRGQLVNSLSMDWGAKGNNYLNWDGKDSSGRDCAAGLYFFKAETLGGSGILKAVKLR